MPPVLSNKECYQQLIVLSKELVPMKEFFGTITAKEYEIRKVFDELAVVNTGLVDQLERIESVAKQTAEAAVEDAKREQESYESLAREKGEVESELREKEAALQARELTIRELEHKLQSQGEELERQAAELARLTEFRETTLGSLRAAKQALSVLTQSVRSFEEPEEGVGPEAEPDQAEATAGEVQELKNLKQGMELEIEKLRADNREKNVMIQLKTSEIEITRQDLEAKIRQLEDLLRKRNGKKRPDFVSYLVDIGKKH
jgi:chromosome segregation ATPase